MTTLPMVIRPIRDSLNRAASDLAAAADGAAPALPALRDAALALENHLDTFAKELPTVSDSGVLARARRLEAAIRAALAETWAIERDARSGPVEPGRLAALAHRLLRAASDEFALVAEQLRDDGALD